MIAPAYRPAFLNLTTAGGPIEALGFVANHGHEKIKPGIPAQTQAKMIAGAKGLLGTNFDYLSDTYRRLEHLDIEDTYISELYKAVVALQDASA